MSKSQNTKLDEALRNYFNGNRMKNDGAKIERDNEKIIEREFVTLKQDSYILPISNILDLKVTFGENSNEEIDPKQLFERNPEAFWQLVSIPMTNAKNLLGDKEVARVTRPIKKTKLKIEKIKNKAE